MKTSFSMIATLGVASAALISVACADADPTPIGGGGFGTGGAAPGATGGAAPVPGATGGAAPVPGATGGAPAGATGGAPAGGGDTVSTFVTGGLGENGTWKGYLFTAAETGSMITPDAFDGAQICASGTLAASYEEWAMIGWNINQEIDPTTFEGGMALDTDPGGTGVSYSVTNAGGTELRIQIQNAAGTGRWCATIPKTALTGTIPWSDFEPECWSTGDKTLPKYAGEQIAQVAVQVPSSSESSQTLFDYCVVTLGPAE